MQRISQMLAALAMLVSGGFVAKQVDAASVDAQPVAKSGTSNPWPFGDTGKCACAFCTGKATVGKVTDHTQL